MGYGVVRGEAESGAEDAHEREYKKLRGDLILVAALTVLILVGSLPHMLGFTTPFPMGWLNLVLLAFATPVQFWAGRRFYRAARDALKHGQVNINTLVVMAVKGTEHGILVKGGEALEGAHKLTTVVLDKTAEPGVLAGLLAPLGATTRLSRAGRIAVQGEKGLFPSGLAGPFLVPALGCSVPVPGGIAGGKARKLPAPGALDLRRRRKDVRGS